MGLGNEEARNFSGFRTPFSQVYGAYWGATALKNPHTLMAVAMAGDEAGGKYILYAEGQLNHTVEAVKQTVSVDGSPEEWLDDSVFFVGSSSQAQATIRVAYDDDNLYFLVERLDEDIVHRSDLDCDAMELLLNLGDRHKSAIDDTVWKLSLNVKGLRQCCRGNAGGGFEAYPVLGAQAAVRVYGTVNDARDTDIGFVTEVSIPWNALGGIPEDGRLGLSATLYNVDSNASVVESMTGDQPTDWYTVILN